MLVVSLVWHALFVVEVIWGLTPLLQDAGYVIWALFLLGFAIGLPLRRASLPMCVTTG